MNHQACPIRIASWGYPWIPWTSIGYCPGTDKRRIGNNCKKRKTCQHIISLKYVLVFGGFGSVRDDRTDHTNLFPRRHQKVHFSTFDGRLEFQCTRNDLQKPFILSRVYPEHLYYFSSISHHHVSQTHFARKRKNDVQHDSIMEPKSTQNLMPKWSGSTLGHQGCSENHQD